MAINNVNEFLRKTFSKTIFGTPALRPIAVCADGFNLSIQASSMHYCRPSKDLQDGDYSKVELGNLSETVEEFLPYAENEARPLFTVYGYVPVETVDAVLAKHGGMIYENLTNFRKVFVKCLTISQKRMNEIKQYTDDGKEQDEIEFESVIFADGMHMDVRCIPRHNGPSWCEAAIYREDEDIVTSEPSNSFYNHWVCQTANATYHLYMGIDDE